jgi:hypothetical protein
LRITTVFCLIILYCAGCNLLNDFTQANADSSLAQNGISGVWFSSNPKITLDTIKLRMGPDIIYLTHKQAESGISFRRDSLISKIFRDSLFHINLQLKGRHVLINSATTSMATGEIMCYVRQDSLLVLNRDISDIHCEGQKLEVFDNQNHLCLGIYAGDYNVIRIKGYFAGQKSTLIIGEKEIRVISKLNPYYRSACDSAVAKLLPAYHFSKRPS